MKRSEMIDILRYVANDLAFKHNDTFHIDDINEVIDEIDALAVRIELSVLGGVLTVDETQASTDLRIIIDTVDHDSDFFESQVDGIIVVDESILPEKYLKNESIAFGDEHRANGMTDIGREDL